jgi:hypothetical protein
MWEVDCMADSGFNISMLLKKTAAAAPALEQA